MRSGRDDPPHAEDQAREPAGWQRPTWAVAAFVLALVIILTGLSPLAPEDAPFRETDALGVALVVASVLALAGLRRAPLAVLAFSGAVVVLNAVAGYTVAAVQWPVWIALYACFAAPRHGLRAPAVAVTGLRATGREVRLDLPRLDLDPGTSRTLYLIVQEALTNALKHATGPIEVTATEDDGRVVAEVRSTGARPSPPGHVPGHGLTNMRERARLEGGTFEAGPDQGGFRVHVALPLRDPVEGVTS